MVDYEAVLSLHEVGNFRLVVFSDIIVERKAVGVFLADHGEESDNSDEFVVRFVFQVWDAGEAEEDLAEEVEVYGGQG